MNRKLKKLEIYSIIYKDFRSYFRKGSWTICHTIYITQYISHISNNKIVNSSLASYNFCLLSRSLSCMKCLLLKYRLKKVMFHLNGVLKNSSIISFT